ncbi:MAG: hypothetical protein NTU57_00235 [Candidatus Aenigmarchaeota archaeon]|nr:hypothetical protein [Candidatus Aenigmarchaeota archaeon]
MKKNPFKNYTGKEGGLGQTESQFKEYLRLGLSGLGTAYDLLVNGTNFAKPKREVYGKTVIDGEPVTLADSDYIGWVLDTNGGRSDKVNLGACVSDTGEIFVNPDSIRWGYHPLEIFGHELAHKNGILDEGQADAAGAIFYKGKVSKLSN